ncbi:MAG: hypothetical protein K2P80_05935 [Beijerinckiaceae bacterium]|nr:hypothetical protein [Beijerinckiaceae bacterium]
MENTLIRTIPVIAFLVIGAAASAAQSEINTQPKPAPAAPGNIGVIDNTDRTGTVDRHKTPIKENGQSPALNREKSKDLSNDQNAGRKNSPSFSPSKEYPKYLITFLNIRDYPS